MKKLIIPILLIIIIGVIFVCLKFNNSNENVNNDKERIYQLFYNFPDSKNIYYISKNMYSDRSIGPTIYKVYILAELTNDSFNVFNNKVELEKQEKVDIMLNPLSNNYNWNKVINTDVIESKNNEVITIENIYLDEFYKTIYIVAIGGN